MPSISEMEPDNSPRSEQHVRWWQYALAITLTAGSIALIVWLVRTAVRTFTDLPSTTSARIVTASATVMVALITVLATRYFERRSDAEREQRSKRVPVYEDFVKGLLDLIGATRAPEARADPTVEEVYAIFAKFTETLVVWGSDEVIREWVKYRAATMASETDEDNTRNLLRLEDLFLAIRRDLGLRNKALARGDLLRLWINDLDP